MSADAHPHSQALFDRARTVLPGGNTRTTVFHAPHPLYAASGEGCRLTDVDGVPRIDFLNNYTALIHGHRHPEIVAAVRDQLGRGTAFANPTESEVELAELLCGRVESFEQVRFCNSGSEAVMIALKAAQAHTERPRFAKAEGCYHGSYTPVEVSLDAGPGNWGDAARPVPVPYSRGTPQSVLDEVVVIPFNDAAAAERILEPHAAQLAALLIDPMPNRVGMIPATPEFLGFCREFCDRHGIVLIFDEVITFRTGYGGQQGQMGVMPDLTTLAKIIGGGFPVGALAGRSAVMRVFDPTQGKPALPHGGTYNANPVTMVAGSAAMRMLNPAAFARLAALGEQTREALRQAFRLAEMPGQVTGEGSLFCLHFSEEPLTDYRSARKDDAAAARMGHLHGYLLEHGIVISPSGMGCLSTPMGEGEIDQLAETVLDGLKDLRQHEYAGA